MAEAGGRSVHRSVQVDHVLRFVALPAGGELLDLTHGAGGHAEAVLERVPESRVVGVDRDPEILEVARARLERFGERARTVVSAFDRVDEICERSERERFDAVLLDLGVSSLQLDRADRGFSFDQDGPLSMQMGPDATRSAAQLVNEGSRDELLFAIGTLGEEPRAKRIVDEILNARRRAPIRRTCELADLIRDVARGPSGHHPATRSFQGLRMVVNDELGMLERVIPRAIARLNDGGRMVVISFHSGEDRVVKNAFRDLGRRGDVKVLTTKPVSPAADEVARNPRARSSRLRAAERTINGGAL